MMQNLPAGYKERMDILTRSLGEVSDRIWAIVSEFDCDNFELAGPKCRVKIFPKDDTDSTPHAVDPAATKAAMEALNGHAQLSATILKELMLSIAHQLQAAEREVQEMYVFEINWTGGASLRLRFLRSGPGRWNLIQKVRAN